MHVLIVHDNIARQNDLRIAFTGAGFDVTLACSQRVAESCLRRGTVDLLIMAERVEGRLTHALSLLAECRNPLVETIMLTMRTDPDIEEIFQLLPSLHCLVAPDVATKTITKLALAAVQGARDVHTTLTLSPEHRIDPPAISVVSASPHLPAPPVPKVAAHMVREFASIRGPHRVVQLQEFA